MKLFNSFSIQMVGLDFNVVGKELSLEEAKALVAKEGFDSYIGHQDTARVLSAMLAVDIPAERRFGTIGVGESALVAQVIGGRLPEGATTLPEGLELRFCLVTRSA